MSLPFQDLSLRELEQRCQRETLQHRRGERSNPNYCLEIFRRALINTTAPQERSSAVGAASLATAANKIVYADEEARAVLVMIYTEFIKAQINRAAIPQQSSEELIQQAWFYFWQAANRGLDFASLESALAYLKQTTITTLIKYRRRARAQSRESSLQNNSDDQAAEQFVDPSADLEMLHARERFRDRCREVLSDPLEYTLFWARYGQGIAPRDIARRLMDKGTLLQGRAATARGVSDALDRCFRRLEADPEIRALLQSD